MKKTTKNKKTPYLNFYTRCMEIGFMPSIGLCESLSDNEELKEYFTPTAKDSRKYAKTVYPGDLFRGDGNLIKAFPKLYWGADDYATRYNGFGPTRQNIVLLLAAMNGEL
jgi:hypothetical protein